MRRQLAIFAKVPRLGQVKRRLAREIGDVAAWRFQRARLAALLRGLARNPRWRATLFLTPDRLARGGGLRVNGLRLRAQGPGDLGARMRRAFLAKGHGPVVLVGSDIPSLGPNQIRDAFRALGRKNDLVFGPAKDGGYWLIASARRRGRMPPLAPVRWSSKHALADTRACFDKRHNIALLEMMEDVDDGAAYRRWRKRKSSP
ncbi:MAG: TIGR04282 family arsenosugar biosynthesis glycosyltransferase [Alphaproteobacteria bacterium]